MWGDGKKEGVQLVVGLGILENCWNGNRLFLRYRDFFIDI
jgi:hypothetical protein